MKTDHDHGGDDFHPEPRPRHRSTARRATLIALASLVLTMLFDADGLLRTARRQQLGWPRSVALQVMEPTARLSAALRLDRPHRWLTDATGHHQSTDISSTADVKLAHEGPATTALAPGVEHATTTTTTLPPFRTPDSTNPLKVLVAGDSLSDGIAISLANALAGLPAVLKTDEHPGTGLARPDVVDWPRELTKTMDEQQPDVVVLIFGGNDAQALRTVDGWIRIADGQAWNDEYQRRIAQIMNITAREGVSVYWIGLPVMGVASMQAQVPTMNGLIELEASARPHAVTYVDPDPAIAAPDGSFTPSLVGDDGRPVMVRHEDRVHMTLAGTDRVVGLFVLQMIQTRHLTAPRPEVPAG